MLTSRRVGRIDSTMIIVESGYTLSFPYSELGSAELQEKGFEQDSLTRFLSVER